MPDLNIDNLLSGTIPESLEDKTLAASQLVRVARRIVPVSSMLIAAARRDHFAGSVMEWVEWCKNNFDLDGSDRDHRRKIGEILLDHRDKHGVYTTLFTLAFDKLHAISRIPSHQIQAFMSKHDVRDMSRDELRAAVKSWLGEEPLAKEDTPDLPGFDSLVNSIVAMPPEAVLSSVASEDKAQKALKAGFGLFGAALEYKKQQEIVDVAFLQKVKLALTQEITEIESAIARANTTDNKE